MHGIELFVRIILLKIIIFEEKLRDYFNDHFGNLFIPQ